MTGFMGWADFFATPWDWMGWADDGLEVYP